MSVGKKIVELTPNKYTPVENFSFGGYECPNCFGAGYFRQEVDRDTVICEPCSFCRGAGKVKCNVRIKWEPENEKENIRERR